MKAIQTRISQLFMPSINLDYMQIIQNHCLSLPLQRFVTELTAYLT